MSNHDVLDGEIYPPDEPTPAELRDGGWNVAQDYIINEMLKPSGIGQGPYATPRTLREVMWGLDMVVVNGKVMTTGRNRAEKRRQTAKAVSQAKQIYLNRKG